MKNQFNGKPPKWKPCFECSSIAKRAILGLDVEGMQAMEPFIGHRQKAASPEEAKETCLDNQMRQTYLMVVLPVNPVMDAAIFCGQSPAGLGKNGG